MQTPEPPPSLVLPNLLQGRPCHHRPLLGGLLQPSPSMLALSFLADPNLLLLQGRPLHHRPLLLQLRAQDHDSKRHVESLDVGQYIPGEHRVKP